MILAAEPSRNSLQHREEIIKILKPPEKKVLNL
jgi:hypothetical protein